MHTKLLNTKRCKVFYFELALKANYSLKKGFWREKWGVFGVSNLELLHPWRKAVDDSIVGVVVID